MINSFYCTNIFTGNAAEMIRFYRETLEIPVLKTDVDEADGVYLGFAQGAPSICIWDATKWNVPASGGMSFVFRCDNLDATMAELEKKGLVLPAPERFDWGAYELRLKDPDNHEIVIAESSNQPGDSQ